MGKKVLLLSNNADDKVFVTEVGATADMPLVVLDRVEDIPDMISSGDANEVGAIFIDMPSPTEMKALEELIQNKIGLFSERLNTNYFHFLTELELNKATFILESPLFGNHIIRNFESPKEDGHHYGRLVAAGQEERAFGLAQLMKTKVQVVKLLASGQKQEAVDAVRNYLLAAKFKPRMATVIANAVDEILMNAVFDAPVDTLGKSLLQTTPRSAAIELAGKNAVEMQVAYDGTYVGVSVSDLYGSLDKKKVVGHLMKTYAKEEYRVRTGVQGAGVGLAQVFKSGGSLLFACENNVRTEVTVFFRRMDYFREFKDQFKFVGTLYYF